MYVYANCSCAVSHQGAVYRLSKGDAWYGDDPFVKARPELFDAAPTEVHGTRGHIETATAAPGEKRPARKRA